MGVFAFNYFNPGGNVFAAPSSLFPGSPYNLTWSEVWQFFMPLKQLYLFFHRGVTHGHKRRDLKQGTFINSQFLWVRLWRAKRCPLLRVPRGCNPGVSHVFLLGPGSSSRLTCLLAEFGFLLLQVWAPLPPFLLALSGEWRGLLSVSGGCHSSLPCVFLTGSYTPFSQHSRVGESLYSSPLRGSLITQPPTTFKSEWFHTGETAEASSGCINVPTSRCGY